MFVLPGNQSSELPWPVWTTNGVSFTAASHRITCILPSRSEDCEIRLVCLRRRLACWRKEADVTVVESAAFNEIDRNIVRVFADIWNDEIRHGFALWAKRSKLTKRTETKHDKYISVDFSILISSILCLCKLILFPIYCTSYRIRIPSLGHRALEKS